MPSVRSILLLLATVALMLVMAERCPHCDDTAAAALTSAAVWGRYRDLLARQGKLLTPQGRRKRTVGNYRQTLWQFWGWLATKRHKTWDQATRADLDGFLRRKVSAGRRVGLHLAGNTSANDASRVRTFYHACYQQGWLATDRMRGALVPRGGQPVPRALEPTELRAALLAAADDPRLWLLLWLGYGAGLRTSEIAGLRVEHLHLAERGSWLLVADGKGGKQRAVPVYPEVRAALVRWMALAGCAGAGPLFASSHRRGQPIGHGYVGRLIAQHLHALGIDQTAHGLRHTFTSQLLEQAGEEHALTIAWMAGWESVDMMLKVYGLAYRGRRGQQVIACLPDPTRNGQGRAVFEQVPDPAGPTTKEAGP
jgi:site-specific recombinase XerD